MGPYLGWENFPTVPHAFVIIHLEYCNILYYIQLPLKVLLKACYTNVEGHTLVTNRLLGEI